MAEFLLEGEEAHRLLEAAQGDVEGAEIGGGVEEAVQADLQEGQFLQEGGMMGLVFLAALLVQVGGVLPPFTPGGMGTGALLPRSANSTWVDPGLQRPLMEVLFKL